MAHRRAFQAGAFVFTEGDACAGFHLILDGLVRIYRLNAEGRLHTLSLLRAPSTFAHTGAKGAQAASAASGSRAVAGGNGGEGNEDGDDDETTEEEGDG